MQRSFALFLASFLAITAKVQTQTSTEIFGSGAYQFSIDFVDIGNSGQSGATNGWPNPVGSVGYSYKLGKYEISAEIIVKVNYASSLGIIHSGGGSMAAYGVSWYDAARFVNYLNTSKGFNPAYKFDSSGNFQLWSPGDPGYDANNKFRNKQARFVIPSVDEWYKGAYGSPAGIWYFYPNGSSSMPAYITSGTEGAVYAVSFQGQPAPVNLAGSLSAWGTMGQGGNVNEWNETALDQINDDPSETRICRGGTWSQNGSYLFANQPNYNNPSARLDGVFVNQDGPGFRVAMLPETTNQVTTNTYSLFIQKSYDLQNWINISSNKVSDTNSKSFFRIEIKKE